MLSRFSFWRVHAPPGLGDLRPCFPIFTSACCSSAGVGHGPWLPLPAFVPAPPSVGGGSWELGERVPRRRGAGCLEGGPLSESRGKQRAGSDYILQALEERSCALPGRKGDPEGTAGRAGRGHGYSPRLRLPWPLGLSLELGLRRPCAPGRPVVGLQALPRFPRRFPCLRSAARGQAWSSPGSAGLRSGAHIFTGARLSKQAHHFPGVGRTGEREQRPARAPEPGGHLSSI